jgi:3-methyladenine DNA glycosylase AlkD
MANARISDWLVELRSSMRKQGDSARALQQQAYMKSEMPYHGLSNAEMRAICRETFEDYPFDDAEVWRKDVLAIWRDAAKREERYAAIELAQHRKAKKAFYKDLTSLPMLEEMIVSGAWWDYVDALASHNVAWILEADPKPMKKAMRRWSTDDDMWKRRTSIICQLHVKEIDLDLLYECIEPSIASKEFFLRKAIGWALREHAWDDPKEITRYVTKNAERLSPLSIREALKNVKGVDVKKLLASTSSPAPSPHLRAQERSSRSEDLAPSTSARAKKQKKTSAAPRTPSRARRGS